MTARPDATPAWLKFHDAVLRQDAERSESRRVATEQHAAMVAEMQPDHDAALAARAAAAAEIEAVDLWLAGLYGSGFPRPDATSTKKENASRRLHPHLKLVD